MGIPRRASPAICEGLKRRASDAFTLFELVDKLRDNLEQIAYNSHVGKLEDGRFGIRVDGDDRFGLFHAREVLNCPGDAASNVDIRLDRFTCLADLQGIGNPPGIHYGP